MYLAIEKSTCEEFTRNLNEQSKDSTKKRVDCLIVGLYAFVNKTYTMSNKRFL